ncbi:MAG: FxsA family protein [Acidimicrobiales bacterium]
MVAGALALGRRSLAPPADCGRPEASGAGDGAVLALLGAWWLSVWGLYAMFGWTVTNVPAGSHPMISSRFYLPAVGAVGLLAAWLLVRLPAWVGVVAIAALLVVSVTAAGAALDGDWLFSDDLARDVPSSSSSVPPAPSVPDNRQAPWVRRRATARPRAGSGAWPGRRPGTRSAVMTGPAAGPNEGAAGRLGPMGLALFLLFIVLPLIELAVIIQVGSLIGVLPTFAIMVLSALIGSWLCKREGLGVLRRINASLDAGRVPTTELADGALIVLAGCMMITPGFVTDLAGILLLLPPVRALVRKVVVARSRRRIDRAVAGAGPARFTFIRMGDVSGFGGSRSTRSAAVVARVGPTAT